VAFLQGRSQGPFLVMRSQYTETHGSGIQPAPYGWVFAYAADGSEAPGWPVRLPGVVEYYGSAQEFVTEGTSAPVAVDLTGTGQGPDSVAVAAVLSPPMLLDGLGQVISTYQAGSADPPISFTTSAAFGKVGGVLSLSA